MGEGYSGAFISLLAELNEVIAQTREPLEGNVFYNHHEPNFSDASFAPHFAIKRSNLISACKGRGHVLEIGVNGGHSALLMLYHNPNLRYVGVDICTHGYTHQAMLFLDRMFPGRVEFLVGDSLEVLPIIEKQRPDLRFDVVHVDGLHTQYHCENDTQNSLKITSPYAWIILDDTDLPHIDAYYKQLLSQHVLLARKPQGWTETPFHVIGMTAT